MPSPSLRIVQPPTIPNPTSWTVSGVRQALDSHEVGEFYDSAALFKSFGRDDRIKPCFDDRANALVGADAAEFSIQPVDGDLKPQSENLVVDVTGWWDEVITDSWATKTLKDGIGLGFSVSYIPWKREARQWLPLSPVHWDAQAVRWSEMDQLFVAQTLDGQQIGIHPDDPNWFVFAPGGHHTFLAGAVRGLGIPYIMRQWDWRDWARYNERHGLPIIVLEEPSGEGQHGEKQAFFSGVKKMGQSGILRVVKGETDAQSYGAHFIEAKARSYDSFDKFLDKLNVAIAIYLKGQNLTTEVQQGAYASTGWHMRVRRDYAANDAAAFGSDLRRQFIQRWGRFNVSGWQDKAAPWPTWNLQIPEDQTALAETFLKSMQGIAIARKERLPVDYATLGARLGIPWLKDAQFPEFATSEQDNDTQ